MAQRRMLYSSIFANAELNMRPVEVRLLYIGLIVLADDDGKLRADPRYLKGQIFSYDEKITANDVENWLQNLHTFGQILLYEIDGVKILKHPNWKQYQRIRADLYAPSKLPNPLRSRNSDVTEKSLKISKEKISKDNIAEPSSAHEEIVEIIDAFEDINPAFQKWYGNKTQRASIGRLLELHGIEKLLKVIKVLRQSNMQPYLPTITSPLQLEDKWSSLESGLLKMKNKTPQTTGRGLA